MIKVAGIRFKEVGKIYYFDPGEFEIEQGQSVVVETVRGIEYGKVAIGSRFVPQKEVYQPLKKILRIATEEDDKKNEENKKQEKEAFELCQCKIEKHKLEMKLIDVEFTFDNNKIIFYFTADGRVDFRELVKDLASVFRTRIELR
ncbi:MAG: stage 0 sporulation protein, partial [Peptostreptococcaceae bacterium]|nr:stage 0 sporulation protein [Peptostreptococcaceae bacterium]